MIKELMHAPFFLGGKSEVATKEDLHVAEDLLETLRAHKETCVGMAANMIGLTNNIRGRHFPLSFKCLPLFFIRSFYCFFIIFS